MSLLAYLLLMVFMLGIGTLAASMSPMRHAPIGLGAVLFLALVVDTTWFLAPLVDWSPGLADAAWVGAFGIIALGAVVAAVLARRAPTPLIWPSRRDLLFLGMVIALFGAVVLVLPVPLDTDAQGFGYLALTLRDGHDYTSLAPWHPEIDYLYSPGFIGLVAHLGARFELGLDTLQLIFGALEAVLFVWLAYDLGSEWGGARTGRGFMLAALIGTGLITAFMDSHYTALLAVLFSLAFILFVLRFMRTLRWSSALFAAICLAAVPFSQPDTTIALMIGYVPWLAVVWLSRPRPSLETWLTLAAVIPLVALGITAPWLLSLRDLLGADIASPFVVDSDHWRTLVFTHGGAVVALAALGALIGLWRRGPIHLFMIIWLLGIAEFSTLGLLEKNLPGLVEPLLKYDYPFSLAWHGPIIPYTVLGGTALVWLADRLGGARLDRLVGRLAIPVLGLALIALAAGVALLDPLVTASKDHLSFYGAFSSAADVDALRWLRDHAPAGARILNHPGPHEGDWAPVIGERDTVYFRPQPFFRHTGWAAREQEAFRAFWRNPTDPAADYAALFAQARIQYVVVPQVFGDPRQLENMLRWRGPLEEAAAYLPALLDDVPFLQLIYERDGAQIYQVILPNVVTD